MTTVGNNESTYILDTDKCRDCGKKEECSCYKTKTCGSGTASTVGEAVTKNA